MLTADPLTAPDAFVDDLIALGRGEGAGGVLFPTHDEAVAAIGPREAEVDAVLRRPWSPWATMSRIIDKGHQHATARADRLPGARHGGAGTAAPTSPRRRAACGSR